MRADKYADDVHLTLGEIQHKLDNGGWDQEADKVIRDLVTAIREASLTILELLEKHNAE